MKKNKTMRLASWLLVLTLLTTCIISGTFAKYVTSDEGDDTARVAKWGVTATVSGSLFGEHYNWGDFDTEEHPNQVSASYTGSVDSISEDGEIGDGGNIVAPGTESGTNPFSIDVSGTPEVAVSVELKVNSQSSKNFSDIWLAKGQYGVMSKVTDTTKRDNFSGLYVKTGNQYELATTYTEGEDYYKLIDTVNMENYPKKEDEVGYDENRRLVNDKYYPIIWNLEETVYDEASSTGSSDFYSVEQLRETLEKTSQYDSLTNLNALGYGMKTISWKWPYATEEEKGDDYEDNAIVDGCDTILGNLMAYNGGDDYQVVQIESKTTTDTEGNSVTIYTYTGATVSEDSNGVTYASVDNTNIACLTVGFNASVTVTQVD